MFVPILLSLTWLPPGFAHITTFDPREATISSTHQSLYSGLTTCRQVVSSFLSRIEEYNHVINAIITLNPHSLDIADRYDERLTSSNGSFGPLFCIPILLKDNYDTVDMPTTGGSLSLGDSQPSADAPSVVALRTAGAIILGKTNLHELALEGVSVSSLGGQTINPYDPYRTPGGSSGGTGAAIAASFAVWGTGTDTVNSLRSPANANGLSSCRPTRGLISRSGVIPVSYTQDAIGPIARCVEDVAVALTVMASVGFDPADNTTDLVPPGIYGIDYSAGLSLGSLNGSRFGLIKGFFNTTPSSETSPVNEAFGNLTSRLEAAGATIVNIEDDAYNAATILDTLDTQRYEFREAMDSYLQNPTLKGQHPSTLSQLLTTEKFLVIPAQYDFITAALASSTSNQSTDGRRGYDAVKHGIQSLKITLKNTFVHHQLDALIYPQQKNLIVPLGAASQSGRNGILAAVTGSPVVALPIGFSPATASAPEGLPIGMEVLGRPWTEAKLLQIAYQIQKLEPMRRPPRWARETASEKFYAVIPKVTPDRGNIPMEYPLGQL